jgi:hypothetical protein
VALREGAELRKTKSKESELHGDKGLRVAVRAFGSEGRESMKAEGVEEL